MLGRGAHRRHPGGKARAELIPLAHPIAVSRVAVDFDLRKKPAAIVVRARVECRGPTGVEMEALTAAAVGLLTDLRHGEGGRPRHDARQSQAGGETRRQVRGIPPTGSLEYAGLWETG